MSRQSKATVPLYFCDLLTGELWDMSQPAALFADSWFRCNRAGYSLQRLEQHLTDLLTGVVDRDPGVLAALESNPELLPMLLGGLMRGSSDLAAMGQEQNTGYVAFLYRFSPTTVVRPGAFPCRNAETVPLRIFDLAMTMLELDLKYSPQWFGGRKSVRYCVDELEGVVTQ